MKLSLFFTVFLLATTFAAPRGGSLSLPAPLQNDKRNLAIFPSRTIAQRAFSPNRAGAVLLRAPEGETFTSVTGTFIVPTPARGQGGGTNSKYSAGIWVGIVANKDQDIVLQAGVIAAITGSTTSFTAWYAWYPGSTTDFTATQFSAKAGDSIKITVSTTSATEGTVVIENVTANKKVTQTVTAPVSVAPEEWTAQSTAWMVEGYQLAGELVPLARFGRVQFTNCAAGTSGGKSLGVTGAGLYEVQTISGQVYTKTTLPSASSILITY
ncbi:concanavalin A-like lectin/glucanase [Cadophora sp. DSE1049]|nr:concanavalin A-like lectin/glucanase [Cadophora sp. DSE1049]